MPVGQYAGEWLRIEEAAAGGHSGVSEDIGAITPYQQSAGASDTIRCRLAVFIEREIGPVAGPAVCKIVCQQDVARAKANQRDQ